MSENFKTPIENLPGNNLEEMKELLQKNLELTQEIHEMTHKIKSYITFQKFMSTIYFLIIFVPIILSLIYLPPLLKGLFSQYGDLLQGGQGDQLKNLLNGQSGLQDLLPKK